MSGGTKIFRRGVSETSTLVQDLGVLGDIRQEADGKMYRLVKAGAALANGQLVQLDSVSGTGTSPWMVEGAHASTVPVFGARQAGSVAAAGFCFVQCQGPITLTGTYVGSDLSIGLNQALELNSDKRLESFHTVTVDIDVPGCGQALMTRASDAASTVTFAMWLDGMGI